jgi:hypothetical protein
MTEAEFLLIEPLGHEARAEVDVHLLQRALTRVGEGMWLVCVDDHDIARLQLVVLAADGARA